MEEDEEENTGPYYNPHLLVTGSLAALGGLLIYALIAGIIILVCRWR